MSKIKNLEISKEKFKNLDSIKDKIEHNLWVDFVNCNLDYYTWYEETTEGIHLKNNMDNVPDSFKEKVLNSLNKTKAYAEYNSKKGYYEIIVYFNMNYGIVYTTFQKKITKKHLQKLLEMANYLDALLLNNGTEVIDEKTIESYEKNKNR